MKELCRHVSLLYRLPPQHVTGVAAYHAATPRQAFHRSSRPSLAPYTRRAGSLARCRVSRRGVIRREKAKRYSAAACAAHVNSLLTKHMRNTIRLVSASGVYHPRIEIRPPAGTELNGEEGRRAPARQLLAWFFCVVRSRAQSAYAARELSRRRRHSTPTPPRIVCHAAPVPPCVLLTH